jgi:inorganic pyrophosphatase
MKIITGGVPYIDIDVYAGATAYAELLNLQGEQATAVSSAVINQSVTPSLLGLHAALVTDYEPSPADEFVVIDTSDPAFFDTVVDLDKVTMVIDHHPGFEEYWRQKLGPAAIIEPIGAACTLVYEAWARAGKVDEISPMSASLLVAGILDNTLNFKANVTTDRDKNAYQVLLQKAHISDTFSADYFNECQSAIENNLEQAIVDDLKRFPQYPAMPAVLGQLVVWNTAALLTSHRRQIEIVLSNIAPDWAINIADIQAGASYFLASEGSSQEKLSKLANVAFSDGIARANRLWLRKELLKIAIAN